LLLLISLLAACSAPAANTQVPTTPAPATTTQAPTSSIPATTAEAKPQGELIAAVSGLAVKISCPGEQISGAAQIINLVYDMLIYWDHVNRKLYLDSPKAGKSHQMLLPSLIIYAKAFNLQMDGES